MKKLWAILLAVLLTATVVGPASAWQFELEGHWLWGYDYVAQGGRSGFFGPYDFSAYTSSGGPKFNSMNAFLGFRTINGIQYGLVTGADGSLQWSRMELLPTIRLNKAMRFSAWYQIGNGTNEYGLYANSTAFGAWNPIASGTWTQWWMTAQTPMDVFVAGKRGFPWGMGLQYQADSTTSESLGFVAPYGPLRVGVVIYPWRGQTWVNSLTGRDVISSTTGSGPQFQPTALGNQFDVYATQTTVYRLWDNDRKRQLQPGAFVTYEAGNISTGIVYEWFTEHNGPAAALQNGNTTTGDLQARTYY